MRKREWLAISLVTTMLLVVLAVVARADVEDMTLSLTPARLNVSGQGQYFEVHITDPDG